ncbi:hypothetical protein A3J20_01310 [Candidatus Gottesmanbacteria bacterium RIFCSPLOWO2_02_FULL_42_29]|uniref:Glycosyltransferase 2-like domain-containing protein n=1 Tax=Candidatus Gottesmanbacteria bacterium RIFCSPLOWO2_01_FULL_42_22 TaxID=1798391 RepID=A0A1F6BCT7_9BACT|nr:MAG: hypothetical protein A2781_06035 [Candidatus Gottesmanbacteria bacterium RIFCSPHIGHO2_01_FULL_42_27]OGG22000.1 MAG: hypothetical protein A3E72_00795 [Candidatus Gottesmanbacteria bacterium RIFCSPHIGHO2_12_FULL_43_26]OGG33547.1 MAG: hypothetical protein A3G68_00450 [Candidatus Gottesmanbacteria bacterium RIFCSPLOWO2_12_FULL_42_10]OGG34710.1 MAG: hypothetical protein A2968_02865 [Candidatus Gottesmanbacteria bacterium RIFCSPLOWO2_01_FULL_42_22]OGG39219.1 MAG: hypothetical protein A3J20_01
MKPPFFSVVLPTWNRSAYIKSVISLIREQTFTDFEIIIQDNASTDRTEEEVKSLNDPRIRYYRNRHFLPFYKNIQKAILHARGKYIFLLGDDDYILFKGTFLRLAEIIKKQKYGFIRLNFLERKFYEPGLQKIYHDNRHDIVIDRGSQSKKILDFFEEIHIGHLAGLVFKNEKIKKEDFFDSEISPWVRILFKNTKKYGALFLSSHYVVISIAVITDIYPAYDAIKNKRLMYEYFMDNIADLLPPGQFKKYTSDYYHRFIPLLPCVKFYSNNLNLLQFSRRLIIAEPAIRNKYLFWVYLFVSFLIPRFIFALMRLIQHRLKNKINNLGNLTQIYRRYSDIAYSYPIFR